MTSILPAKIDDHLVLPPSDSAHRYTIAFGIALSLLLHLLLASLWLNLSPADLADTRNDLVPVELVLEQPSAPAVPPPRPVPPPPPPPPAEPPAPPPQPPAPQPPAPPPPAPPPPAAAAPPVPPPPPIQRETARNAARSSVPAPAPARPPPGEAAAPAARAPVPGSIISPDGLLAPLRIAPEPPKAMLGVTRDRTPVPPSGPPGETLAQSEVDHLLAQILAVWIIDFRAERFRDLSIMGAFELNPNGTLAAPFGAYDPWRPELMIADYQIMLARPDLRDQRTIMESFLGAMRQAQPFKRQPDAAPLTETKVLRFAFRLGDLAPP